MLTRAERLLLVTIARTMTSHNDEMRYAIKKVIEEDLRRAKEEQMPDAYEENMNRDH